MLYRVGIENNVEGRSMAWALDHPGCFSYGPTAERALAGLPEVIWDYQAWIQARTNGTGWIEDGEIEFYLDGSWDVYAIDEAFDLASEGYEVNAWYLHDWKPLTDEEVLRGLKVLEWSRVDLLESAEGLDLSALQAERAGEKWNIAGILKHVAGAEWWYLDRLGLAFPKAELPADPFERLDKVRMRLNQVLPELAGSRQVRGMNGEFWSPRKLLRRTTWHERDHTAHIRRLRWG
jgi:uncharacterized damage-inducible protein DinB